ncbi:FHA domain-containing protein [Planosporangium flavigriseum]|uniref:Cell division protein FtsK n=1 Tax=Planosporangium flavigriseum TaxID=373681 RepID=A0A8J3LVR7_9ACTN|nr:FtsK/SpoIIIE domain-containing protein [Planosporangium flavigriseum]NJC63103.1 FHA domain-containing protein [Planosporangium flavigriseum]GIG74481.1 cell division protein FtsK [Planosporangium flavigriseum]
MRIPLTVMLSGARHDLYVDIAGEARVDDLRVALARHFDVTAQARLSTDAGPVDPAATVVAAGVRAGSVLHLSRQHGSDAEAGGSQPPLRRRQLRVISGADAGLIMALPATGTVTIGRSPENEIRLSVPEASRRHAALRCRVDGVELADIGSRHGTLLDGERLTRPVGWLPGMVAQIGDDRLVLSNGDDPDDPEAAAVTPLPDGRLRFVRQHRFVEPSVPAVVELPRRPQTASRASFAMGLGAVSGLVLGAVAYVVWHNLMFLLFAAVGTATLALSSFATWWQGRRTRAKAERRYEETMSRRQSELAGLLTDEQARRARQAPDVLRVVLTAERTGKRLWERRPGHEDFLEVRLGMADQPSAVAVRDPDAEDAPAPVIPGAPVTVSLATFGTIGLTGPRAQTRAVARWIVAQAAVQTGPADLSIVVLARPGNADARSTWDWVRWLPHARPPTGPLARVGCDEATLRGQIDALAAVVAARRESAAHGPRRYQHNWLVVVDDLPEYDHPGLADVLSHGPEVGVFVVAVDQLPYRCPATVTCADARYLQLRRTGQPDLTVLADQLSPVVAERIGRALAPLHDPEAQAAAVALPSEVALLDLVPTLDLPVLVEQWARTPRQTRVVLGRTGDGPLLVDLAANGPHALVAGATGWGKSALLQSLVGSLALANRPDELGFILVDFKGGAAFNAFAGLPHTVGSISNLDGHQVMRALDSLAGEMRRRQRYLATAGVEKLEQYQQLGDTGALPPECPRRLPRLLVVIDEFAMLKEELPPEILTRLVHVATQGRSLGLHLIIGTQTPRGVIPSEIRPNINLQIALHLPTEHSIDVVGIPDAGSLTVKGRGYLRRGEDAAVTLFQSAFLGGQTRRAPGQPVRVIRAPWELLGYPPPAAGVVDVRDIDVLVEAVRAAARIGSLNGPARPWLPEPPPVLPLSEVDPPQPTGVSLGYGREDHPEERAQPTAGWRLTGGTNLLVAGRPRSGRTTLLRTLAASAAAHYRPDEVALYVMDCGGGGLADLAELPHCGAVVEHTELDRGARLLARLEQTVNLRERSGADGYTVLLIDDWETWQQTFGEVDSGALHDQLVRIVRKGPAAGVHVAITGTSTLLSSGRARPLVEASHDRLALPFDPADYAYLGVPATALPAEPRPGQAVRVTPPYRTVQVAVVGTDPHPDAQIRALRAMAASADDGPGPWRVDRLPAYLTVAEADALPRPPEADSALWVPFGAGGDELSLLGGDLHADGPGLFVVGERRSGRSSTLLGIALELVGRGVEVVVLSPVRSSPLRDLSGVPGVAAILSAPQPTLRQAQLALAAAGDAPTVVLVDDAERLVRTEANAVLRDFLSNADHAGTGMVVATGYDEVAAPAPGTFLADVGAGGTGLLLGPRAPRIQLFGAFTRIPQAYLGGEPVGRAVLLRRHAMAPVQVADPTGGGLGGGSSRVPALLEVTDALAGPMPATADRLRAIVAELRGAGFTSLDEAAVQRAVGLARQGWSGGPAELVKAVS